MTSPKQFATEIVQTLRRRGYQAYFVGGCVRDLLLSREPADYDVSTDATPDEVMHIFPETYAVGAQFGVVLVPLPKEQDVAVDADATTFGHHNAVEVATFRSDIGYTDGRHPDQVRYTKSGQEDVLRRDFTINGLLLDPITNEVLDYVDGRADLERRLVRTIGDPAQRFAEDKLRMLRAVRFAARFEYTVEPATFAAIRRLAEQISQVSHERIRDELIKMLTEGHARRAFELLDQTGLLHEVLPEIEKTKGVEQPPQFHPEGDVWTHTLMLLDQLKPGSPRNLALGALLHDVGKPPTFRVAPDRIRFDGHAEVGTKMAEAICRRLRLSSHDTEQVTSLVANHMRFADVQRMKESTLKRFFRLPKFDEHLEMHRFDCLASHRDLTLYNFVRDKLATTPAGEIRPTPLINGNDLIAAGYTPGPQFAQILAAVEDLQLEGRLKTKDDALEFVRRKFAAAGEDQK